MTSFEEALRARRTLVSTVLRGSGVRDVAIVADASGSYTLRVSLRGTPRARHGGRRMAVPTEVSGVPVTVATPVRE